MIHIPDDPQEVVNIVVAGLASQGFQRSIREEPAADVGYLCQYRGEDGRKCAAGWLIKDEDYNTDWDEMKEGDTGTSWYTLVDKHYAEDKHRHIIQHLQSDHDNSVTPEDMKRRLKHTIEDYNLKVPEVLLS